MNKAVEVFKDIPKEEYWAGPACEKCSPEGRKVLVFPQTVERVFNRILAERAVRVTGDTNCDTGWAMFTQTERDPLSKGHTHQALLISIQPIAKEDSAEGLLRELCQWASESNVIEYTGNKPPNTLNMHSIIGRARKLLDKQATKG